MNPFSFEKKLQELGGDEIASEFNEILAEAQEEAEEDGYNRGCKDTYLEGEIPERYEDLLKERFRYLTLHDGQWQKVDECEAPSEYARGFLDAMKTLGVKP